jgi:hypothetical protein
MRKKRKVLFAIAMLVLLPELSRANRISFKLTAGLNYGLFGDINAGVKGYLDYWKDLAVLVGGSYVNSTKPLHASFGYSIDLIYKIDSYYSVGLGVGYVRANNKSEMSLLWPTGPETSASVLPDVRAVPIRLTALYFIPFDQRTNVFFTAGLDTYFAQFRSSDWPGGAGNSIHQKASAIGLGLRYGVGLEIGFAPHLAFVLEGQGCYSRIRGFHGTLKAGGSSLPFEETGTLYYWDQMGGPDNQTPYPRVLVQEAAPSGDVYANVRKARVDFSGFSILVGIKMYL